MLVSIRPIVNLAEGKPLHFLFCRRGSFDHFDSDFHRQRIFHMQPNYETIYEVIFTVEWTLAQFSRGSSKTNFILVAVCLCWAICVRHFNFDLCRLRAVQINARRSLSKYIFDDDSQRNVFLTQKPCWHAPPQSAKWNAGKIAMRKWKMAFETWHNGTETNCKKNVWMQPETHIKLFSAEKQKTVH